MLRGFGCQGPVKSPTYTFVESYNFKYFFVYHFDLYRLSDPEELEFLGVRDYFSKNSLCLVEWAENGEGFLPAADIEIMIHSYNEGRVLQIDSHTVVGVTLCKELSNLTAEYMRK
ncbi:UNVERIFIED_CONTAM: hypothetical protein GTU68_036782 [Idotea baltica]|nr:hypothetical protein [Idotea baltica]